MQQAGTEEEIEGKKCWVAQMRLNSSRCIVLTRHLCSIHFSLFDAECIIFTAPNINDIPQIITDVSPRCEGNTSFAKP